MRIPPGVVEKEDLVDRVWALVEEEKRKDNEGIDDIGEIDEDEIEGFEEPDREEEAVMEMVDPESEVHPDVAHEHGRGYGYPHVTADEYGYDDDPEMTQEYHSAPAMDSGLPHSRSTTPQPSASFPKPSASPSHAAQQSKPRARPKSATAERSGLCVICQDEEANIAIVDCGCVISVIIFPG